MTQILKKPLEKRSMVDFCALEPLLRNVSFLKEKKIKEKNLTFICKQLKFHEAKAGTNVITYGKKRDSQPPK